MKTKRTVSSFKSLVSLSLVSLLTTFYVIYFPKLIVKLKCGNVVVDLPISVQLALNGTNLLSKFDGFNYDTGVDHFVVPNIIHYVRFHKKSWTFVEYICMRSAYINQRPDYIFIHTDVDEFKGKYWNWIQREPDLRSRIVRIPTQAPDNIFGQEFRPDLKFYHGSDVSRIRALIKYGGIYLDNDVYVVNNLDKYRKFEMTLGWPKNESLGNMVLIANKNARFLQLWLEDYRDFKKEIWYYNGGDHPTATILLKHPELVHREKSRLGIHFMINEIYQSAEYNWREKLDTVHLLTNHRSYIDFYFKDYRYFNERNIIHYPFKFGEMVRSVLNYVPQGNYTIHSIYCKK